MYLSKSAEDIHESCGYENNTQVVTECTSVMIQDLYWSARPIIDLIFKHEACP